MVGYCNVDDVQAVVDTDMETHEIQDLIDETDAFIAAKIDVSSTDSKILRAISKTWTAYRVMLKDPASESLAGHSENRSENLRLLKDEYKDMLATAGGGIAFKMTSSPIG